MCEATRCTHLLCLTWLCCPALQLWWQTAEKQLEAVHAELLLLRGRCKDLEGELQRVDEQNRTSKAGCAEGELQSHVGRWP